MRSRKSIILFTVLAVLVVMQFFRPGKNNSPDSEFALANKYALTGSVDDIMKKACYDCHSNQTNYPWYAEIQPIGWWLNSHVQDGKRHFNFSDFTRATIARQNHKFEEVIETVEEGEMPLPSYTWLGMHPEADLTEQERTEIINWAKWQMEALKKQYPADSLKMKPRQ
ncbi:MAG TPA: heme-binding domain-containing protein [Chryseosolibacter sp.]